MIVHSNF